MIRNTFKDPSPKLTGAPSSRQSGIRFKSPSVDSPNLQLPDDINPNNSSTYSPTGFDTSLTSGNASYVDPRTGDVQHTNAPVDPSNIDYKSVDPVSQLRPSSKHLNDLRSYENAPNSQLKYGDRTKVVNLKTNGVNSPTTDQVQESSLNTFK
jgi:hypothetical protein